MKNLSDIPTASIEMPCAPMYDDDKGKTEATDDTNTVTSRTELGKRLRELRAPIVAGGARLLGWDELEKRDEPTEP